MRRLRKTGSVRTRTTVWVRNPLNDRVCSILISRPLITLSRGSVALLALCVCLVLSACTSGQKPVAPIRYHNGPADVDMELSEPQSVARYRQLRQARRYRYDTTEVDLATPLTPSELMRQLSPGW